MCGLTGFWSGGRGNVDELAHLAGTMAEVLAHRGPDDSGVWVDAGCSLAFGFRRLAILELSPLGSQPMVSASGRYVIVFNGEIYNFEILRSELQSLGHLFRGRSDTEVLLAAIEEWGFAKSLVLLDGMFAIAVWDREERSLSLARDHLGIKPLYYGLARDTLLFASELKAFEPHPKFQPEVDSAALALYFRHGFIPSPYSIFRGIRKLGPGCFVTFRHPAQPAAPEAYWSMEEVVGRGKQHPFTGHEEDALDELELLMRNSVRRRMIAEVPLGAFLSGGIDSSLIVALMQAQSCRASRTFTIAFEEERFNEAPYAASVANYLGTEHEELTATPAEALNLIPSLPSMFDEPFADVSQIPTHLASLLTRGYVKVCLSGDGGDELFGGYSHYWTSPAMRHSVEKIPAFMRPYFGIAARKLGAWLQGFSGREPRRIGGSLAARSDFFLAGSESDLIKIHNSYWAGNENTIGMLPDFLDDSSAVFSSELDYMDRLMIYDSLVGLPDNMLTKVDRASSRAGLEVRVPLLDIRIVEFARRLPARWKVRGYGQGKWILRQLLRRYLPSELVERPKQGFGVPIATWLRGPLRDWAESLLCPKLLESSGIRVTPVRNEWKNLLRSGCEWEPRIWIILAYQAWRMRWTS